VIAAWLRVTCNATNVRALDPKKLNGELARLFADALTRPVTWFARTRRLLVDGLRLGKLAVPGGKSANLAPDPTAYLDYGAHAGGLEAFWGTHPFSPGPMVRAGAPPSHRIVSVMLDGTTFAGIAPVESQIATESVRTRKKRNIKPTTSSPKVARGNKEAFGKSTRAKKVVLRKQTKKAVAGKLGVSGPSSASLGKKKRAEKKARTKGHVQTRGSRRTARKN
jgi:hypothetical protein